MLLVREKCNKCLTIVKGELAVGALPTGLSYACNLFGGLGLSHCRGCSRGLFNLIENDSLRSHAPSLRPLRVSRLGPSSLPRAEGAGGGQGGACANECCGEGGRMRGNSCEDAKRLRGFLRELNGLRGRKRPSFRGRRWCKGCG